MKSSSNKLFEPALVQTALKESFIKLDPRVMIKNPVMFTVEIGTLIMAYGIFFYPYRTGFASL
jgi:K+-transporting ATPase ATPase B chain